MSEPTPAPSTSSPPRRGGLLATTLLVLVVVVLFVVSSLIGLQAAGDADEPFGGTDAQVTEVLEEDGHEPWFTPLFEPAGEVESGLFALQAGLGGIVLGFALGRLSGRARSRATD